MDKELQKEDCCEYKDGIMKRLKRIEGQVKGIQKMVQEDKSCIEVLTQIAAVRAAINKTGGLILEKYSKTCMQKVILSDNKEVVVEELMDTIQKFLKYVD